MQFDFTDKRILVTGGTRGIGWAVVEAFLLAGAHVAINGRTEQSVKTAIAKMNGDNRLFAAPGDISSVADCGAAVNSAVDNLGGLDVLINSAGIGKDVPIEDSDEALWDATLDINLKGTFFCSKAALGALRASNGNIVNVASDAGLMGNLNSSVYCASKGGVVNLTRAMALELAPDVRVNCVCPGYVDTDMVRRDWIEKGDDPVGREQKLCNYAPMGRLATPREIAHSILYLASYEARFATGTTLQIDGGATAGH